MNRADATKALNDLTADFEKNAAALRAIIEAPEKPQGRRDWKEEDLCAGLRFKTNWGTVRTLVKPVPRGWEFQTGYCAEPDSILRSLNDRDLNPNLNPDIHGANPSEDARLWLESFVPVYGLTVPDIETLQKGWCIDWRDDGFGEVVNCKPNITSPACLPVSYSDGSWHPTREAAEAWLERFGKVRGFGK